MNLKREEDFFFFREVPESAVSGEFSGKGFFLHKKARNGSIVVDICWTAAGIMGLFPVIRPPEPGSGGQPARRTEDSVS